MRRLMLVIAVVALTGCSDLFKAHADEAASAGSLTLKPERLAEILTGPKGIRLNSEAATFVTGLWLDYALFSDAIADHKMPEDSAAVALALWPAIAGIKAERWHDSVVSRRLNLTDAGLDSVFTTGPLRIFQHMLFTVSQTATPEEHAAARKKAEDALAQVNKGANFGALASRLSQDPGSAADSGYLPPRPRGGFVTAFDSAGWTLKPGEVSGVVQTPYGYHVIRRPTLDDARSRFRQSAEEVVVARVDSVYFDSLAQRWNLKISNNAPSRMREGLDDKEGSRNSRDKLATWTGGSLTVGRLLQWIGQLPPGSDYQIAQMADSQLIHYARVVSQNEMLLQEADSNHIGPTPAEWAGLREQYQAQVDSLTNEMGLSADISDTTVSLAQRNQIAAMRLKAYFDAIVSGKQRARRLPASLAEVLRDRIPHRINESGVQRGLELAQALKAKQSGPDSAQAASMQRPGLRPAPGPAPAPAGTH